MTTKDLKRNFDGDLIQDPYPVFMSPNRDHVCLHVMFAM